MKQDLPHETIILADLGRTNGVIPGPAARQGWIILTGGGICRDSSIQQG